MISFLNSEHYNYHQLCNLNDASTNNVFFSWFSKFTNFKTISNNIVESSSKNTQWFNINTNEIEKFNNWDYSGNINHYIEMILEIEDNWDPSFGNYAANIFLWFLPTIDEHIIVNMFFENLLPLKHIINLSSVPYTNTDIFHKIIQHALDNNYYVWDCKSCTITNVYDNLHNINISIKHPNDLIYNLSIKP
jgi:hypothetical protein